MGVDNYSYIIVTDTYTVGNSNRIFCGSIIFGILCIFPFAFFSGVSMWLGGAGMIIKSFFAHAGFANMVMQIGIGCIFFGLGLFIAWATVVVCIKLFPWVIRKIVDLGSRLF